MKRHLLSAALAAILTGAAFAQTPALRPLAFKDAAVGIEFTRDVPKLDEFFSLNSSVEWGPQAGSHLLAAIPAASVSTPDGSLIDDLGALPLALGDEWTSTASVSPADEDPLGPAPAIADDGSAPYTVSSNTVAEEDPLGVQVNFQVDDAM